MMSLVDRRGRKHTVSVFDVFGSGRTIRRNRRIATEQELRKANSEGQDAEKAKDKLEKKPDRYARKEHITKQADKQGDNTGVGSMDTAQDTTTPPGTPEASGSGISGKKLASAWTEADDEKLLSLKDDKKNTWNVIASVIGKSKGEVRKRYGELKSAKMTIKPNGKDKQEETTTKKSGEENESAVADLLGLGNLVDANVGVDPCTHPGGPKTFNQSKSEGKKAVPQVIRNKEGDVLSVANTMLLTRLHDFFEQQKWIAIASRFFDETGRYISPESLQDQFEAVNN